MNRNGRKMRRPSVLGRLRGNGFARLKRLKRWGHVTVWATPSRLCQAKIAFRVAEGRMTSAFLSTEGR